MLHAVLQGMSLREAAARYWPLELPLLDAKRRYEGLRVALLAAARCAGHFGEARALSLDMAGLPAARAIAGPPRPSFEDFVACIDPKGYYSEVEALEFYAQQYPPDDGERRRTQLDRLRDRQRRSLSVLEPVLVQRPASGDPLDTWINPRVAARLAAFEIRTPAELVAAINCVGLTWCRRVPRVGRIAADRLVKWLQTNELSIRARIEPGALIPRAQLIEAVRTARPVLAVVPMEKLALPATLDGHDGSNRAPDACQIVAVNDLAAIEAWLAARATGSLHSERAYRKEPERLLLWAVFARKRAMSSLNVDDAIRAGRSDPEGESAPRVACGPCPAIRSASCRCRSREPASSREQRRPTAGTRRHSPRSALSRQGRACSRQRRAVRPRAGEAPPPQQAGQRGTNLLENAASGMLSR